MKSSQLMPIVFVHGAWCGNWVWEELLKEFEPGRYAIHFAELPFHAATDNQRVSEANFSLYCDAVKKVAIEVGRRYGRKPIMVGHSLGAVIIQSLASLGLVERAILIAPASPGGVFQVTPKMLKVFSWWITRWGFWKSSSKMPFKHFHRYLLNGWDEIAAQNLYGRLVHESGRVLAQIAFWDASTFVPPDSVSCPVLCLAGARDHIATPAAVRHLASRYRGQYREYEASHFLFRESAHVRQIAKDIADFLREPDWKQEAALKVA